MIAESVQPVRQARWKPLLMWHFTGCLVGGALGGAVQLRESVRNAEYVAGGVLATFLFLAGSMALLMLGATPVGLALLFAWRRVSVKYLPLLESSIAVRRCALTGLALTMPPVLWNYWRVMVGEFGSLDTSAASAELFAWLPFYYPLYVTMSVGWLVLPRIIVPSLRGRL